MDGLHEDRLLICKRCTEHRCDHCAASQVVWTVLVEAIPTVGKNTQQIKGAILKQVKAYEKLLNAFCGSARVEASLIVHLQVRGAGCPMSWQPSYVQEAPWALMLQDIYLWLPVAHEACAACG